jgi:sugar/nucleoside kinase (ribokinase family)
MTSTLIVGGLTVDRFADGGVAPGGSVLHSGLAAVEAGSELTVLTVAGDEPAAAEGLARLAAIGMLARQAAAATTTYRHEERDGVRVLIFEARTEPIRPDGLRGMPRPDVALVAPIADEVPASLVARLRDELAPPRTVLLVQGWLRRLVEGEEVTATPLDALTDEQRKALGEADSIVVSTEDLVESPGDPFGQAAELRRRAGQRPVILVTLGAQGYLLDDPNEERVVASVPRRVVTGVPSVGAGDTFGAALAVHLARGVAARHAADRATDAVISMLEARDGNPSVPEHRPEPA